MRMEELEMKAESAAVVDVVVVTAQLVVITSAVAVVVSMVEVEKSGVRKSLMAGVETAMREERMELESVLE